MTGVEDVPSCAATENPSYASRQGRASESPLVAWRTAGELFSDLGLGGTDRSARVEARPGLKDVVEPPEHERPSGVDPGITVTGGIGGIRARLDDLVLVASMLGAQAQGLDEAAEQAVGIARDAESWSLLIQDRREALRADGGAVAAGSYVDQAVATFRARLSAALFVADRCASRASGLARDLEDVVAALDGARKSYEAAEKKAAGVMLSTSNNFVRGFTSAFPWVNSLGSSVLVGMWGASNGIDKAGEAVGWDPGLRDRLPGSQEMLGSILDQARRGMLGGFAADSDPRDAVRSTAGAATKLVFGPFGLYRKGAVVERKKVQRFIPPARDLASAARALEQVSKAGDGAVGVQRVRLPDGTSAWTVLVPGTQSNPFLWRQDHGRDGISAVVTTTSEQTAAALAPLLALQKAGARPGDKVSFVGHSQGGTIVQMAAADRGVRATYDVGSVVSFSSPTPAGTVPEDPDVNHLELSNTTDIVPMLDGVPPAAGANHVNVHVQDSKLADESLKERSSDQGGRHSLATAVAVSEVAQRGTDPSLRRSLARLADDLSGGPAPATGLGTPGETPLRSMLDGGVQVFSVTAR